ncbi:MAG: phosphatase PAP2 family protein [Alphaproteobacteria bacterium]|nr:phosphatase PAP2 family protein [Alphaproteobacteria bacterium]
MQDSNQAIGVQANRVNIRDFILQRPVWRYAVLILILHAVMLGVTAMAASIISSPFSLWFNDTNLLLAVVALYVLFVGSLWHIALILLSILDDVKTKISGAPLFPEPLRSNLFAMKFYPVGLSALLIIVLTCLAILGTSNITLLSFKLLSGTTEWRDGIFWAIEGPLFEWLSTLHINTNFWDPLYHSCWAIEMAMVCFLIVVSQSTRVVFFYGYSMIILYYLGRFIGMLNPVKGPAFYKPEYFNHAADSLTKMAVDKLNHTLALPLDQAIQEGGILLGGISAMPSLHIGMITLTSYWLYTTRKWTLVVTIPWVVMVWISTVVLGWHYVIDGVGGVLLAAFSIWVTGYILKFSWGGLTKDIRGVL